jgi:excisionase family DNA binding protein
LKKRKTINPQPFYYTRKEAAAVCRVSLSTLDKWRALGHLPSFAEGGIVLIPRHAVHNLASVKGVETP